jgi:hypothetical protein
MSLNLLQMIRLVSDLHSVFESGRDKTCNALHRVTSKTSAMRKLRYGIATRSLADNQKYGKANLRAATDVRFAKTSFIR